MTTSSENNPGPGPDEANMTPSPAPHRQPSPQLPTRHSPPDAIDAAVAPATPPAGQQAAAIGIDVAGATRASALSNMQYVIDLADSVVHIADDLHQRILQEIASYSGRMPDTQKALMHALTDDVLLLRQYAHALYADAATFVIHDLEEPQHHLMALTTEAAEKIRHIGVVSEVTGLVGGILLLVGSIAKGQFSKVGAALKKIQRHNAALKTLKPGLPAKA